jgi:hypothetical protein
VALCFGAQPIELSKMTKGTFPDQFGVSFIRDALWRTSGGGAAVMIGAGFSRNARPTSISAKEMPSWAQMSQALCRLLYASAPEERRESALREANSTSGFLRLAQEYEAAYGRLALNEQIRALVPDMEYEPDDLHKRLLNLPWKDVLTTNWDTLLEREARNVFKRNYDVVRTPSEIPTARRPRIVKLHGTLPAYEPFIFTEDDYRIYPRAHAPFVNLVQQSLMESVLCLIGFSGDDPNFLHWTGWVRDNLGKNAPKVYLVGWLELSSHRRRMLEDRNVVPIDLANLPNARDWPAEHRHRYATEWFLRAIGTEKRFDPTNWPRLTSAASSAPLYLGPIPAPVEKLPQEELDFIDFPNKTVEERIAAMREVVAIWKWNRSLYPGWMIAPLGRREAIWRRTLNWVTPICSLIDNVSADEYLIVFSELVWRLELALAPHFVDVLQSADKALSRVDIKACQILDVGSLRTDVSTVDWSKLRSAWSTIALMLVKARRFDGEFAAAATLMTELEVRVKHDVGLQSEVMYEACLLLRDKGQYSLLAGTLSKWDVSKSDPAWAIRKAGLLASLGDLATAHQIFRSALTEIRRHRRRDCIDFASLSREGWALWFEAAFARSASEGETDHQSDSEAGSKPTNRWLELGIYLCDTFNDYHRLISNLDASISNRRPSVEQVPGFDLGNIRRTFYATGVLPTHVRLAYEIFRLADAIGIPPSINRISVFETGLNKAISAMANDEVWLCALWSLRIAVIPKDDALEFFSRSRVAMLNDQQLLGLNKVIEGKMSFALANFGHGHGTYADHQSAELGIAIEVLSRLALRCNSTDAEKIFEQALSFFNNSIFQGDFGLYGPLHNLIKRTMEAVPVEFLAESMPKLFSLPLIPGKDWHWPEPAEAWPSSLIIKTVNVHNRPAQWKAVIHQLLDDFSRGDSTMSQRALRRLSIINAAGILTGEEQLQIADWLWDPSQLDKSGWPQRFTLCDYEILSLPEQTKGQAEAAFRKRYFLNSDDYSANQRISAVGTALEYFQTASIPFELSTDEKLLLSENIQVWAQPSSASEHDKFLALFRNISAEPNDLDVLSVLMSLLLVVPLSQEQARSLWTRLSDVEATHPGPVLGLYAILLRYLPEHLEFVARKIREGLVSSDSLRGQGACNGLRRWMMQHKENTSMPAPPDDLAREVGNGIAVRRPATLIAGLEFAKWLIHEGPANYRPLLLESAAQALAYLFEEAKYDGPFTAMSGVDLPLLRLRCIQLARALDASGYATNEAIRTWLDSAITDPLPEVRKALSDLGTLRHPITLYP